MLILLTECSAWKGLRFGTGLGWPRVFYSKKGIAGILNRTSSSAALAAEWGLWGATVALLLVTKHALGPWWGTIGLLGASLAADSLFLQVGLNRRCDLMHSALSERAC